VSRRGLVGGSLAVGRRSVSLNPTARRAPHRPPTQPNPIQFNQNPRRGPERRQHQLGGRHRGQQPLAAARLGGHRHGGCGWGDTQPTMVSQPEPTRRLPDLPTEPIPNRVNPQPNQSPTETNPQPPTDTNQPPSPSAPRWMRYRGSWSFWPTPLTTTSSSSCCRSGGRISHPSVGRPGWS
jgi:hypothetical protein